jgi:hypothetical protein
MNDTLKATDERTILPDGMDDARLVLIKACSALRLTAEIRRAASAAQRSGRVFILAVPEASLLDEDLLAFARAAGVEVMRTD